MTRDDELYRAYILAIIGDPASRDYKDIQLLTAEAIGVLCRLSCESPPRRHILNKTELAEKVKLLSHSEKEILMKAITTAEPEDRVSVKLSHSSHKRLNKLADLSMGCGLNSKCSICGATFTNMGDLKDKLEKRLEEGKTQEPISSTDLARELTVAALTATAEKAAGYDKPENFKNYVLDKDASSENEE